jgi:hypothetical protein
VAHAFILGASTQKHQVKSDVQCTHLMANNRAQNIKCWRT